MRRARPPQTSISEPFGDTDADFWSGAATVLCGNECGSAPARLGRFVTGSCGVWLPLSQ
jgi:hypothetical protein